MTTAISSGQPAGHQYDDGMTKKRITVTLDAALVEDGNRAVAEGRADSMSAWVNEALATYSDRLARLRGLREVIAEYEAEHGAFTEEELAEQARLDREEIERNARKYGLRSPFEGVEES